MQTDGIVAKTKTAGTIYMKFRFTDLLRNTQLLFM
jgi:hypothetical protein